MPEPTYRHLQAQQEGRVLVLTVRERAVESDQVAEALRDEMLAAVGQAGATLVVVDFRNTEYISSVAFRPLLALRRKLQEAGGRLVLCGLAPAIGDVFYTTRLCCPDGSFAAPFEMDKDVAAAVAKLGAAPGA